MLEAPDLKLVRFGEMGVVVGPTYAASIKSPPEGASYLGDPPELPTDLLLLDSGWLGTHHCGNGDIVLTLHELGNYHSWRRTNGRWSSKKYGEGIVAGCGGDWTLYATPTTNGGQEAWRLDVEGGHYRTPTLSRSVEGTACSDRLELADVLALPSGEIIAAGTACSGPKKGQVAVEHLWLGKERSSFRFLPGSADAVAGVQISPTGMEVHVQPSVWETVIYRREGDQWQVQPRGGLEMPLAVGEELWRRDPETESWLVAPLPTPRHPRLRHSKARVVIYYAYNAANGDFWFVYGHNERDCGRCFQYRALLRVKDGEFKPTDRTPY